jgi:hypothetical protein
MKLGSGVAGAVRYRISKGKVMKNRSIRWAGSGALVFAAGFALSQARTALGGPVDILDAIRTVSVDLPVQVGQGVQFIDDSDTGHDDKTFSGAGSFVHTASATAHAAANGSALDGFGTASMDSLFDSSILRFSGKLETHATPTFGQDEYLAFTGDSSAQVSVHFSLADSQPVLFSYDFSTEVSGLHGGNGELSLTDSDGHDVAISPGSLMLGSGTYNLSFSAFAGPSESSAQYEPIHTSYDVALKFGSPSAIPLPAGGWTGLIALAALGASLGVNSWRRQRRLA